MQHLLHVGLLREDNVKAVPSWNHAALKRKRLDFGEDHGVGLIYGIINFVVCVPSLVSYAHIVFPFKEFESQMPFLVKFYFLSSAVIQMVFSLRSTIVFSIGQVQDVGLIFLAAMVKNIVRWSREDKLADEEILATALWNCALATLITGAALIIIGKLKLSSYVQMLPLPIVGGYLGYIGYFCLAAGLSIGSGLELSGPQTLLKLINPELKVKLTLLATMTILMLVVHFKVKHFLGMPIVLLVLPIAFFIGASAMGISVEECRERKLLPPFDPSMMQSGVKAFSLYDTSLVHWEYLPRQIATVFGLVLIVSFGSSLDIAAIQAEMDGQKVNYDKELITIGCSNLLSGACGGATGSYIFSQTIFSAKRGVKSRLNGWMVCFGELSLFLLPVDVLSVLPTCYIGGIMVLFGVDIMNDWLWQSRHLMAKTEYALVWIGFAITMWLTSFETFGVIDGMLVGTIIAAFVFAIQYTRAHKPYALVATRSSVIRPPKERRALNTSGKSIMAVSLNSYLFFGASLGAAQEIEEEAEKRGAKFVCLDFGRLTGMDCTAADQMKQLVLSLERNGMKVLISSVRSALAKRLLAAHGVIGEDAPRKVFGTFDQSIQCCEEELLEKLLGKGRRPTLSNTEQTLSTLLLEYVDGFTANSASEAACVQAASRLTKHFKRVQLPPGGVLFYQDDPADQIFVIAKGSLVLASHTQWMEKVHDAFLPSPQPNMGLYSSPPSSGASRAMERLISPVDGAGDDPTLIRSSYTNHSDDAVIDRVGVGAILGDTAFYARRTHGCDGVAEAAGCVAFRISRQTMEWLEVNEPALVVFLQKVWLRDLTQLQVQFLGPLQAAAGLC